ncbi:MAG: NAD(P)H-quinone oxidoreductase subunit 4, partial [Microcoleaceae cyanobacterium]
QPREVVVATCLLVPIVMIGLYPKVATTTYDAKAIDIAAEVRQAIPVLAENNQQAIDERFYATENFNTPVINPDVQ